MRFMMVMHPPAMDADAWTPDPEAFAAMARYNDELSKAGALLALDGLHHHAEGTRVVFDPEGTSVIDGPFTESKEVVGGYWIIQAASHEEAVEWARRVPATGSGAMVEVRRIHEMADMPQAVQDVAADFDLTRPDQTA